MRTTVRCELPASAHAPRDARLWLHDSLDLRGDAAADLELLITELVTNSVLHSGLSEDDRISVSIARSGAVVRLEVCDEGGRFARPSAAPRRAEGGRGLRLVAALSDDWGVHHDGITRVWLTYRLPGRSTPD